jgi:4-diphosphocytidyl-2-C-methyl-D-erythritol kinase
MIVHTEPGGIEVLAPAKLNLFLEVLGKRDDGYHEVETLMVAVDLHDRLTMADDPSGRITLECNHSGLSCGPENLIVRAANRLREAAGVTRGARISLAKHIPLQAGLAGGSSDAAATLEGLNRLWNLELDRDPLRRLAETLGSDVPFFLHGRAAVCRGRGEVVQPIALAHPLHFVLVIPPVGVSTERVYSSLRTPSEPRSVRTCLDALARGQTEALGRALFNRLQPVAEALVPDLAKVGDALQSLDPSIDGSQLSGSGSAYFGLCRDAPTASQAAGTLERLGLGSVRVVTCGP